MKISVLVPAYNASKTIAESIKSVLRQTIKPHEIIILLDGVDDDAVAVLSQFGSAIRVETQENRGVACARNRLVEFASGDLLAFLDADDIWHPQYLETQLASFDRHPEVVAGFTGHMRFFGDWREQWPDVAQTIRPAIEIIDPVSFFTRYNITTAVFGSMSYCCVTKAAFRQMGDAPFSTDLHAVEDSYMCYRLALLGPVAYCPVVQVAYRMTEGSLSVNRVRNLGLWVKAFERLEPIFNGSASVALSQAFAFFYASKRREYAKVLFGIGDFRTGRQQLSHSLSNCASLGSKTKSTLLLLLSYMPGVIQPTWPASTRQPGPTRSI